MVASCVLAAGTLGFVIGAFVVGSNVTVRDLLPAPQTGIAPNGVTLTDFGPTLPRAGGPPPDDEARARREVVKAIEIASAGSSTAEERESRIQDGEGQQALREEILLHFPAAPIDKWKVTRDTACADLALGGVACPPL